MRVVLSAGEASGDAYGHQIVKALKEAGSFSPQDLAENLVAEMLMEEHEDDIVRVARDLRNIYGSNASGSRSGVLETLTAEIETGTLDRERLLQESLVAIGGRRLKESGAGLVSDSSKWGAVGIIESLFVAPKVYEGYQSMMSVLRTGRPGLFIPIDFGYLNIKLARNAKKLGWKVLYFVPPGSWRKDKQGADLPAITDAIVTPFSWSAEILERMGATAYYFGHPLKEMVSLEHYDGPRDAIAVLPGSRLHEVSRNMDVIAEATQGLGLKLRFAVASNLDVDEVRQKWEQFGGGKAEFERNTYRVLKSSRAAVVCSGTATLEAALCGCPMVVVYRVSKLMELEFRIRKPKFDFISLPNILLGKRVVPELIQYDASPERIRAELVNLLEEGPGRQEQLSAFEGLNSLLGEGKCFQRTAQVAIDLMNGTHR